MTARMLFLIALSGFAACAGSQGGPTVLTPPPAAQKPKLDAAVATIAPTDAQASREREPGPCDLGQKVALEALGAEPTYGSFTEPNQEEVFSWLKCPMPPDTAGRAGVVVLRKAGAEWQIVRFTDSLGNLEFSGTSSPPRCDQLRIKHGHDLMVCHDQQESGGRLYEAVYVLDFNREQFEERVDLVGLEEDTMNTICEGAKSVLIGHIEKYEVIDLDQDGTLDVRIKIRSARAAVAPHAPCSVAPPKMPKAPLLTLEFITKGVELEPTEPTKRLNARLKAERDAELGK